MALVKPIIFQIVGYQNSGKTTFLSKLITLLHMEGLKTVTIKHHGHGGKPSVAEDKDSAKHFAAGAAAALAEGGGRLLMQAEAKFWPLEKQIQLLMFFEPDVILIEGHKHESYPKLLLLRDKEDEKLLTSLKNIKAAVVWDKKQIPDAAAELPFFHLQENDSFMWVLNYIKKRLAEIN